MPTEQYPGAVDAAEAKPDDLSARKEPRRTFNGVVETYDRVRPTYPAAMYDDLFALLPDGPEIIEVGPGTGQATRDLLKRGASVHAIEIGPEMAAKLVDNLRSDGLRVTIGNFEDEPQGSKIADAVCSATAYHWISSNAQTDRPATLLRSGGAIAVVDTIQVDSVDDRGFFARARPTYEQHGSRHLGPPAPTRDAVDPQMRSVLADDPRFGSVTLRTYDWNQTYTAEQYRDLMITYSTTQMMPTEARSALLNDIEHLVRSEFDGVVTRPLVITMLTATLIEA